MLGKRARPIRRTTSMSQFRPGSCVNATEPREDEHTYPVPTLCTHFNHPSGFVPHFALEESMNGAYEGNLAVRNPAVLHEPPVVATYDGHAWTESIAQNDAKNTSQHLPVVLSQRVVEPKSWRSNAYATVIGGREDEFQRCAARNVDDSNVFDGGEQQQILLASSPAFVKDRKERNLLQTPPVGFLDVCFYCHRRLGHGQDIYIYRGDTAFCSVECRQFQIAIDERKEKCSMVAAINKEIAATTPHVSDHNQVVPRRTEAMA